MTLTNEELLTINGGASKSLIYGIIAGVGAVITLIAGIIDGYLNPIKCNMRKR